TGFSIGPSRVNPMTGEILDADVVLTVGFLSSWTRQFELYGGDKLAEAFDSIPQQFLESMKNVDYNARKGFAEENMSLYYSQQFGLADTFFNIMALTDGDEPQAEEPKTEEAASEKSEEEKKAEEEAKAAEEAKKAEEAKAAEEAKKAEEAKAAEEAKKAAEEKAKRREENKKRMQAEHKKVIEQGLASLATHEVGHTLGLRHNFKQSALHTLDEINDASRWTERGYVGSIMEYAPINIMPKGRTQGDYFSVHLGDYDLWVIEYGYRVYPGKSTDSELAELKKLAAQQTKPELNYATDEDAYGTTVDPYVNIWDLGSSPLEYAKVRAELVEQLLPNLNDNIVEPGQSYEILRSRFNSLVSWKGNGMQMAARYIGGMQINRDFKGDENARMPFVVVPAKDQREAMALLNEKVFGVNSYDLPQQIFNYLAPNRWYHWGSTVPSRYDTDVHATILSWQTSILSTLLSTTTLSHLADAELRVAPGEDVFTSAEMIESLTDAIFKEITESANAANNRKEGETPAATQIKSTRRNLQRAYLDRLVSFATDVTGGVGKADFGALARMQLRKVRGNIDAALKGGAQFDAYTRAHMEETRERIIRALDAIQMLGGGAASSGGIVITL
ncbi:MAG: zinc-dependent metalloprotease, partial [Thermoguttaceae bacterium]|nr:zinc-dependent metalloprotease [Thermoguttaceae bacterium]